MEEATRLIKGGGVIEVKKIRRPKTGIVITGNEIYHNRIKDAFGPVVKSKIEAFGGEVAAVIAGSEAFDYLDAPPVVVGSRNWITPAY